MRHSEIRRTATTLALVALFLLCLAGRLETHEVQGPPDYRISVNVHLVLLNATVRDSKGRFATGLSEENFEVYEDSHKQTISVFRHEDIPVTVGLLVDHSGSMRSKLADVIVAARTFVHASSPEDEMFVVNFNEHVTMGLPANLPLSNRMEDLARAIGDTPAAGMTALYDAVFQARKQLQSGTRDKKVLIVISDGGDNASTHSLADVMQLARKSNVMVYTIGIFDVEDADRNPGVLRSLAAVTGGEAFFPEKTSEVVAICERIARDIRNQYTIGYVSGTAARPGVFHAIRVAAASTEYGKLFVRARSGYIAAPATGGETH